MNDMINEMMDGFNYDRFVSKGLYENDVLTDRYYTLVKNYKILLDNYLLNKLSLKKMDDKIINSGLSFVAINNDDMDFYQKFSSMGLKYIYLRNNLYVDKLSYEDIDIIVNLTSNQLKKPSSKIINLIENTYKDVIDSKPLDEDNDVNYMVCYGIDSDEYWVKSDELVIGVRYDEFADNGLGEDDEWMNNYNDQLDFLGKMIMDMNNSCSDILGMKVNFLYFDEAAVINNTIKKK